MPSVKNNNVIVRSFVTDPNNATPGFDIPKKRGRPAKNSNDVTVDSKNKRGLESVELQDFSNLKPTSVPKNELLNLHTRTKLVKQNPRELEAQNHNILNGITKSKRETYFTKSSGSYSKVLEYAGFLFLLLLGIQLFLEFGATKEEKEMIAFDKYLSDIDVQPDIISNEEKISYLKLVESQSKPINQTNTPIGQ